MASFACAGAPLPASASEPVVLGGVVSTTGSGGTTNVASATVSAFRTGNSTALVSGTSTASGAYSLSIPTGNLPVDGYLAATKASYLDTYVYPSEPAAKDGNLDVSMLTSSTFGFLQTFAGVSQNAAKGVVIVQVVDCNDAPIAGATVSSTPGGTVRYLSGGTPSSSATSTDADGVAFIFNVGPGDVAIAASATGGSFRSHTVNARASSAITATRIAPGPH